MIRITLSIYLALSLTQADAQSFNSFFEEESKDSIRTEVTLEKVLLPDFTIEEVMRLRNILAHRRAFNRCTCQYSKKREEKSFQEVLGAIHKELRKRPRA